MKAIKKIGIFLFICFSLIMPIHAENMDDPADVPVTPPRYDEVFPMCKIDDYECINDNVENAPASTSEDIQQAIRSFDSEIAAKEEDKNYLKHFTNSALTATTSTLSLDVGYTVAMFVINSIITVIEAIGSILSLLALTIYNFVSGSAIESLVGGIFDTISTSVFDWSNIRSWVYNLMFLIAGVGIVQKILGLMKKQAGFSSNKQILSIIGSTIFSVCMIVFIGLYGRPTIHYIESLAENSIASTFSFSDDSDNMEIEIKTQIFELMQMKPFMMRHFGTTSIDRIPTDPEKVDGDLHEFNSGRVQALIANPSTSQAISEKKLGNTAIMQGYGTAAACLFNSVLGFIHKIIAGSIVIIMCLVVGCVRLFKEVLLFFSIFGLIFMLMKPNPKTYQWFFNRISWTVIAMVTTILFDVALYAWSSLIDAVTAWGFIFAIVVDVLLVICCMIAWKNKDILLEKFKERQAELSGFASGIFDGTLSPQMAYSKMSSALHKDDDASDGTDSYAPKNPNETLSSRDLFNNNELADSDVDNQDEANKEFDLSDEADLENSTSITESNTDLSDKQTIEKSSGLPIHSKNTSLEGEENEGELEENLEDNSGSFLVVDENLSDNDENGEENLVAEDKSLNEEKMLNSEENLTNEEYSYDREHGNPVIKTADDLKDKQENLLENPFKVDETLTDYNEEKKVEGKTNYAAEKVNEEGINKEDVNNDFLQELNSNSSMREDDHNAEGFILKQPFEDLKESEDLDEMDLDLSDYD